MLHDLKDQPADKILMLMQAFREDPREDKIDLGVGVYRDAEGRTPIMAAVKEAEQRLWNTETTKSYTGLAGDPDYARALGDLILGDAVPSERRAAIATPGGTGAVRQALELMRMAAPGARIWVSDPTWPNHLSIIGHLSLDMRAYRYFDGASGGVDFDGMCADLTGAAEGDLILLHGCCHNPTGANLTLAQWDKIADLIERTGAIPFVDIAYQGFGDGLDADAAGLRRLAARLPQMLIAASCSKNFGIYRERAGLLIAIAPGAEAAKRAQGTLSHLNRQNYSFPPDHGARLVTMVLSDDALRARWQEELEGMRLGMLTLRRQLADELRQRSNSDRFDFVADHRGMFSRLGASPEQVEAMRRDHGIYMVGDSRINIAGLNARTVPILAAAMIESGL